MADGTRLKELQEFQRKTELILIDEKAKRQGSEEQMHSRLDQISKVQDGLQSSVMGLEHSMAAMQQQLKSIAEQLQSYNRNKSILADLWFQGYLEKRGMPSWSEIILIILKRVEDLDYERVVSEFNMLRQETTVHEYLIKFEELESMETFFMIFISGLKEEIKGYVATMNPTTLDQAIVLARRQENMVIALLRKTNQQQRNNQNRTPFKPQNKSLPYKPSFKSRDENPQPRRFLTEAEVRERKEKNLCYKCDEPYIPGHRCKIRQVHMLLTEEEAKAYEEEEDQAEGVQEEEDAIVLVHTMGGNTNSQTLRINVRVANGGRIVSKFFYPNVCWEIQGHHFSHPVRGLKLGGYDCVLWCDWLSTKNPIELDFHKLYVTITQAGKKIILRALIERGDVRVFSAYSLSSLLRRGSQCIKGQLCAAGKNELQDERDPRLLGLLQ
ncbi:UNVERIFIED_CONTAM: hypothetical protein Sradi_4032400 [Sesamum radiatum]|uniref:Retrotransposon gag domain-containing protein n=1 Tax=Sesamum radiatum TaxID=300843 RepID=A0AAW2PL04_SESRA